MLRSVGALVLLVAVAHASQGCDRFPDEDELFDEEVIATVYDRTVDFRSYVTFSIVSSVKTADISDDGTVTEGSLEAESANVLLAKVRLLVQGRGYVLVEPAQAPDLGVGVAVVKGSTSRAVSGGYWGGYYGGYWGYPGAGYYYPFAYAYTYSTGSIVIDMLDLKRARSPEGGKLSPDAGLLTARRDLPVVWGAIAYKALPEHTVSEGDVSAALEQAFIQSPYLRR